MALSQSKLTDELRKICDKDHPEHSFPASRSAAISRWTDAIVTAYSYDADDYSYDAVAALTDAGWTSTLTSLFTSCWSYADGANAFASAWAALWTGGVFGIGSLPPPSGECGNVGGNGIFGTELTSAVMSVSKTSLQTGLQNEFGTNSNDGAQKCTDIASVWHLATIMLSSISVLISGLDTTPPPTGPLPITNTCHVF